MVDTILVIDGRHSDSCHIKIQYLRLIGDGGKPSMERSYCRTTSGVGMKLIVQVSTQASN
jgi:hypothetical protein